MGLCKVWTKSGIFHVWVLLSSHLATLFRPDLWEPRWLLFTVTAPERSCGGQTLINCSCRTVVLTLAKSYVVRKEIRMTVSTFFFPKKWRGGCILAISLVPSGHLEFLWPTALYCLIKRQLLYTVTSSCGETTGCYEDTWLRLQTWVVRKFFSQEGYWTMWPFNPRPKDKEGSN